MCVYNSEMSRVQVQDKGIHYLDLKHKLNVTFYDKCSQSAQTCLVPEVSFIYTGRPTTFGVK